MADKLQLLEERFEQMLTMLNSLKQENAQLCQENSRLKTELGGLRQSVGRLQAFQTDQSETIKAKLAAVLERLQELETITE